MLVHLHHPLRHPWRETNCVVPVVVGQDDLLGIDATCDAKTSVSDWRSTLWSDLYIDRDQVKHWATRSLTPS